MSWKNYLLNFQFSIFFGTYQRICWIEMLNPKFNKYFFLAQFWGTIEKWASLVSQLPISRPITPLSSLCRAEAASPHQNRIVTQNQEFQINSGNKWSRKVKQTFKYCFFMFFYNASETSRINFENVLWWMQKANINFENVLWWRHIAYCESV